MTRKRFVKLLMAYRVPRNQANFFAHLLRALEVPYSDMDVHLCALLYWKDGRKEVTPDA